MAPGSSKIVDLRNLLATRFPIAPIAPGAILPTGLAPLDAATDGGLRKGVITECISPNPSAGSASLIAQLLQTARRQRYFLALVDGRDSFDPQPLAPALLRHLLWIRCRHGLEAVKAADFLLRDGNFPLLILDLVLNDARELRRIPASSWYRLQRLVEPAPVALLVLTRRNLIASAAVKFMLENSWQLGDLEPAGQRKAFRFRVQKKLGARPRAVAG